MTNDAKLLEDIGRVIQSATPDNLGDKFIDVISLRKQFLDPFSLSLAEAALKNLRILVVQSEIGWPLFKSPILPKRNLNDLEIIQLIALESALNELCYCCEMVEYSSVITWGGATPTRFYLNGFYHYTSAMFLIDAKKDSHKNLTMGGTAILALSPLGLSGFLDPIKVILLTPLGGGYSFGEAILRVRNRYLVHGDFSPERIEDFVTETQMRTKIQQEKFSALVWDLFYEVLLLELRIKAIMTIIHPNYLQLISRYLLSTTKK